MSELWICREQTAQVPYRLESVGLSITTVEELCYYLYHSMEYVDESVMEEPLFTWLSFELKLPRLSEALREERSRGRTAFWCAWFLLKEIGMYTGEELKEFQALCQELERQSPAQRRKKRADRMLENGRHGAAIWEYRQILFGEQEEEPAFVGAVWHNMGTAYAGLFLFREAAKAFEKAYGFNHSRESFESCKKALELEKMAGNAGTFAAVTGVCGEMEAEEASGIFTGEAAADWEQRLIQLKNDYRKKVN